MIPLDSADQIERGYKLNEAVSPLRQPLFFKKIKICD
ncbi:hypothetical protein MAMMFC1_02791 [Methylomusa anaerophila]|uniref:Uncharacterized protein n=1 Tax=Methylomusa anaerophila TaxID=1930071 RepID=A0A348AM08_9FIRM|nr:hypothetical protein MAMMFC1_02791 [Methylomusa anaerophila]